MQLPEAWQPHVVGNVTSTHRTGGVLKLKSGKSQVFKFSHLHLPVLQNGIHTFQKRSVFLRVGDRVAIQFKDDGHTIERAYPYHMSYLGIGTDNYRLVSRRGVKTSSSPRFHRADYTDTVLWSGVKPWLASNSFTNHKGEKKSLLACPVGERTTYSVFFEKFDELLQRWVAVPDPRFVSEMT